MPLFFTPYFAGLSVPPPSVQCRYLCTVSKRIDIDTLFYFLLKASFQFIEPHRRYKISRGTRSAGGASNTSGWKNLANIAPYLGNGTRWPWSTNRRVR